MLLILYSDFNITAVYVHTAVNNNRRYRFPGFKKEKVKLSLNIIKTEVRVVAMLRLQRRPSHFMIHEPFQVHLIWMGLRM